MRKIFSPPFAGIPTFAKFPLVSHKDWGEIADSFGIIGVPYDMGTTDLPGARLAPRSIRSTSTQYAYTSSEDNYGLRDSLQGFYDIETSKWILQAKPCYDLGDVEVFAGEPRTTFEHIHTTYSELLNKKIIPVTLGGDHAITFPIVEAYKNVKDLTVIHLDAHMDYWEPKRNSDFDHSCCVWNLSRMDHVKSIYQIGMRGLNHRPEMIEDAKKNKITTITAHHIQKNYQSILEKITLTKNVYVSIDVDVFDPSIAPGTGTREPGGLSYPFVKTLLSDLLNKKSVNLVGLDVTEVNPLVDISNITSLLASRLILDIIGIKN